MVDFLNSLTFFKKLVDTQRMLNDDDVDDDDNQDHHHVFFYYTHSMMMMLMTMMSKTIIMSSSSGTLQTRTHVRSYTRDRTSLLSRTFRRWGLDKCCCCCCCCTVTIQVMGTEEFLLLPFQEVDDHHNHHQHTPLPPLIIIIIITRSTSWSQAASSTWTRRRRCCRQLWWSFCCAAQCCRCSRPRSPGCATSTLSGGSMCTSCSGKCACPWWWWQATQARAPSLIIFIILIILNMIIRHVHLPLISRDFLMTTVDSEPLVRENPDCKELMLEVSVADFTQSIFYVSVKVKNFDQAGVGCEGCRFADL